MRFIPEGGFALSRLDFSDHKEREVLGSVYSFFAGDLRDGCLQFGQGVQGLCEGECVPLGHVCIKQVRSF